jgi:uncharacterized protein (UPF0332 family)
MDKFERDIKRAREEYEEALKSGQIKKSDDNKRFARFFFERSQNSLLTTGILYQISNNPEDKSFLKIDDSYEAFMWTIVSSYYSMFYMASALVAKKGIKVGEIDVHKNVRNAFLRLYIENSDLERKLGIDYTACKEMAQDLMAEREKRSKYQYDVGMSAMRKDAETSVKCARNFFEKTRKAVEK